MKTSNVLRIAFIAMLCTLSHFANAQTTYYATTTGTGAGTQASPASLTGGIALLSDGDILYLAAGTYDIATPINNTLPNNATIEGGFDASTWTKSGTTTIHRTAANVEDTGNEQRIGAIYIENKSGFALKDLTITTANAPTASDFGISTYGLHLSNCSDYTLNGVTVQAGNASAGTDGADGANGEDGTAGLGASSYNGGDGGDGGGFSGSGGVGGTSGSRDGANGTQANSARNGAGGGGGGYGNVGSNNGGNGGADASGNNAASGGNNGNTQGENGAPGTTGTSGAGGGVGIVGQYYQAGSQGDAGTGGTGGGGGESDVAFVGPGGLDPVNGAGGGGGGGQGGTGSYGGGSSYGLFLYQNGTAGLAINCTFTAGAGGNGGQAGSGGTGGMGSAGSSSGGNGGNGGDGGMGQAGTAMNTYTDGASLVVADVLLYVDTDATAGGNGLSWNTAFKDPQDALDVVMADASTNLYQIWVAEGTYSPTADNPASPDNTSRDVTFYTSKNIQLYGGFDGTEAALAQRDWDAHPTILSGDIGTMNVVADNTYHVLYVDGTTANGDITTACVIDGFQIQGGNADGDNLDRNDLGGAIYNDGDNGQSSPSISNCTFSNNTANSAGGAVCNFGELGVSSPSIVNCTFSNNTSNNVGGAICNYGPVGVSSPSIVNCTFSNNTTSDRGGAIFNLQSLGESTSIINCIFWGNTAANGSQICNTDATSIISYTLLEGGLAAIFEDGSSSTTDAGNNLDSDPLFIDAANGNLRLQSNSPAIGTGNNSANSTPTDLGGNKRILDGTIDRGAYEYTPCPVNAFDKAIYVKEVNNTATKDGSNWDNAFTDLQAAIDAACACPENDVDAPPIWVAEGTYLPTADNPASSDNTSRDVTFFISKNIQLYGGFDGTEATLGERDWDAHPTILSGDIGTMNTVADNAYHVLYVDGTTANGNITTACVIDGFQIQGGNADDSSLNLSRGAIFNDGANSNICSPTIRNCTFSNNTARNGGAIFNNGQSGESSPSIINCTFSNNNANNAGGAVCNSGAINGESSPSIINCTFSDNTATIGGAIFNDGFVEGVVNLILSNCTFSNNTASDRGGAIFNNGDVGRVSPSISNCILWGNTAASGNQIYNNGTTPIISSTLLEGGLTAISENIGSSTTDGGNNLDNNPQFIDATNGNLRLKKSSPAIDAGDNGAAGLSGITTDLDGNDRFSSPLSGADFVDMGAYEVQQSTETADADSDAVADDYDNCPLTPNPSLDFDGSNDYVVAVIDELPTGDPTHTIEAWIYVEAWPSARSWPLNLGPFNTGSHHWLLTSGGSLVVGQFAGNQVTKVLTPMKWTHIAAVQNGPSNTFQVYHDGELVGTVSESFGISNRNLHLGRRWNFGSEQYFNGKLDEVRVWNTTRTQQQIRANMYKELKGDEAGLVGYYNFNEGTPNANNTGIASSITDVSGNGNTGSMNGFAKNGTASNWGIGALILHEDQDGNGVGALCEGTTVQVNAKALLQGPTSGSSMSSNLAVPSTSPYTTNSGPTEVSSNVLANDDPNNAIVDWVILELRSDENTAGTTRSALIQRDGDIVDVDGISPVRFDGIMDGDYYVIVKHRNHLSVMTAMKINLN